MSSRLPAIRIVVLLATMTLPIVSCLSEPDVVPAGEFLGPDRPPVETHLRGRVIDLATGLAVGGASVTAAGVSSTSDAEGNYNLQRLRANATDLMTVREGYDTARTFLPLKGGDQEFIVRLRARAAANGIR